MHRPSLFRSFFLAGFECSTQRRRDGRRLDLLEATGHARLVAEDYRQVAGLGMWTVRDGLRWHLIEASPGHYDWSSFLPMLRAARATGVEVIWDLCHYGWPDGLDIWSAAFVDRFAAFAGAAARLVREEGDEVPFYCPVNEVSFWAWACDTKRFHPLAPGRGTELKQQLVRATIAATDAVRAVDPRARFVQVDPLIHVVGGGYNDAQFAARDMLAGMIEPELGGGAAYVDILGVNYYCDNQWHHGGSTIPMGHHDYRPLSALLADIHGRYRRPVLLAETGAEGSGRSAWLHYVASEAREALSQGVPVEGICIYPVVEYPGWDNDRHCATGVLSVPDGAGRRTVHAPLAEELARQQALLQGLHVRPYAGGLAA